MAQPVIYQVAPPQDWDNSLFGCFADPGSCCLTFFCPACSYGCNSAEIRGGGCCAPCCLITLLSICCLGALEARNTRSALRTKYNLAPAACGDCWVYCYCMVCAICQDARENKHRVRTTPVVHATYQAPPQPQMYK